MSLFDSDPLDTLNALPPRGGPPFVRPRSAASLMVVAFERNRWRVLMGRRRADLKFMPGFLVFPGGRVERQDHGHSSAVLKARVRQSLLCDLPRNAPTSLPEALGRAALRECGEETGLAFADPADLSSLSYIARAVTPPGGPRRFDTRFFATTLADPTGESLEASDGEFDALVWLDPQNTEGWQIHPITRAMLHELNRRIRSASLMPNTGGPVPGYRYARGLYRRDHRK